MDNRLYEAGIIAIPVRSMEGFFSPNYLVFDSIGGKTIAQSPNLETGEMQIYECLNMRYRLVYREILQASNGKAEEFEERILLSTQTLDTPVDLVPLFFTHKRIEQNLLVINKALSLFEFRGILEGLTLSVDEVILSEILNENRKELSEDEKEEIAKKYGSEPNTY
ncbi:hypothetical protein [Flectobacillus roseus]|uniref:hypothetical protein n=1 Tax=Flectobacillus roseus TaxID=502259 RepID=UPI0024B7C4E6|nr:hypothetical protein [Flectobacillus roseus]MDI9872229.1 hypothetical protein [Flectobacillus roseus]